ncbi:MAG: RNA methyltransferase, partial [Planctomycetota bacterium]
MSVSLDDPRLAAFRNLNARSTGREESDDTFVAEGSLIVRRLLESSYRVRTIVVDEGRDVSVLGTIPPSVDLITLSREEIATLAGFSFHRGYLASADRPTFESATSVDWNSSGFSLGLVGISDMENVGSMLRSAAAFGVRRILLDHRTVAPLSRRSLRVSMGAALGMEYLRLDRVAEGIEELDHLGVVTLAATLSEDAVPIDDVQTKGRPTVLFVGNEARGLSKRVQSSATHRVQIPMHREAMESLVDSLNVSVA